MAVDFSILQRAPTIGQGILAGQQRGRERELQNRLLARQDLQFQQQQEDRARQLQQTQQQEAIFKQAADMIRQAGLDPDDPQVLQQFTAAAVQSRQPQLISLANTMSERAAKRAEERRRRDLAAKIMAGDEGGAQRGDAAALAAPVAAAAPAAMTQPPAAPAITATTFDEGAARPEMPRPSIAARTAGVEPPMPMGPVRELPPPNALVPAAPAPVNTLVAAPSAAQPAKPAAAPKVDVAALESNLEKLEQRHTQLLNAGLDKEATVFYNSKIKPLEKRVENARRAEERGETRGFQERNLDIQQQRVELEKRRADLQELRDKAQAARDKARANNDAAAAARAQTALDQTNQRLELLRSQIQLAERRFEAESKKLSPTAEKAVLGRQQQAADIDLTVKELEAAVAKGGLIDQSTGSIAGAAGDVAAATMGIATEGAIAIGKLQPIADMVLKTVPRFEGPQSDKDTQSYKEAAGQLANPNVPREIRKEAAKTIIRLMKERKGQFATLDEAAAAARSGRGSVGGEKAPAALPQQAVDALLRGVGTDAQFDEIFGPGAAARARGR